ncbi:MAG: hypothetical protein B6242_04100 [Anaerolineaceae bacterium 4572_78]|nr:MAG: hypothetical protein B6242_04100 [Anaerolineaceae bacterium 4572_78]
MTTFTPKRMMAIHPTEPYGNSGFSCLSLDKNITYFIATMTFIFMLTIGCGKTTIPIQSPSENTPTAVSLADTPTTKIIITPIVDESLNEQIYPEILRVCLLAISDINANNFNGYAYEGMQDAAATHGFETVYFVLDKTGVEDAPEEMANCLATEPQVIITVGIPLSEITTETAKAYPDIFFIGVDHFVLDGTENYVGIQFREDEAGFLVGYMAGLVTKSNIVAGVYGRPYPPLKRFRNGYEQGVKLVAEELGKEITVLGTYLESFIDHEAGAASAEQFINEGADVIFGVAGASGSGAIVFAAQHEVYVIGVDQDEFFTTFDGGKLDGTEYLISSALKHVDIGVYDMLTALARGNMTNFPGGGNYILTIENGGLSFANRHEADISESIYDNVAELELKLASGEISTGVDPESGELLSNKD